MDLFEIEFELSFQKISSVHFAKKGLKVSTNKYEQHFMM